MTDRAPSLYDLLPAYIRFRDAYEGEPLKAVMQGLELPLEMLREDIDALYRGWFIETCDDWRVPYIGDLVGVRGLENPLTRVPTQRTLVANTIAYRRSRGTPAALERVARDVTGWPCHVVEYRRTVAATPNLGAPSSVRGGTVDLRRPDDLEHLGSPFNTLSHSVDLGRLDPTNPPLGSRGGFNLPNLGLAFWRLAAYPVEGGTPRPAEGIGGARRRFTFHPFGLDIPLFNPPRTGKGPVYSSTERNLPLRLRRSRLAREIAALRRGERVKEELMGRDPAFRVWMRRPGEESFRALASEELEICDLGRWRPPAAASGGARVFVDPELGRLMPAEDLAAAELRVDYCYGGSADLGGGPYPRRETVLELSASPWRALVARDGRRHFDEDRQVHHFGSLVDALEAWNRSRVLPIPPRRRMPAPPEEGIIQIADSATYEVDCAVDVEGRRLLIQAADGCCPCLAGGLTAVGLPFGTVHRQGPPAEGAEVELSGQRAGESLLSLAGLWVAGGIEASGGLSLSVDHCTIGPPHPGRREGFGITFEEEAEGAPQPAAEGEEEHSLLRVRNSVVGTLRLGRRHLDLEIADSVVDGGGGPAISGSPDGSQTEARIDRSTLLGEAHVGRLLRATSVLFTGRLVVDVRSEGRVVASYLAEGSSPPRVDDCYGPGARESPVLPPSFTSTRFGDPEYVQLASSSPRQLLSGGEDGNEIGVYVSLRQASRLANLPVALEEFVPWGKLARIFFIT